jgi:phage terminase large subunit-like protein
VSEQLTSSALTRWRVRPAEFIESVLINPETGKPFVLLPAERAFLAHAFKTGESGKLLYPELLYSCPKKSGKTTFAAIIVLTVILLFGDAFPEATLAANDQDQAVGRVFEACRRIIEASPLLKREAKITQDKIIFAALNATITAIPASFAGAAGGNQCISVFDEAWAYVSERSRRLWDELVPPPTRKIACRLTVTYAGFEGESILLQELYNRGKQQPLVGEDLYCGDGLCMFWSHRPIAPWQDEAWLAQMQRERASVYQRMVLNEFAASEAAFTDMGSWDACVQPSLVPVLEDKSLHVWAAVDASVKRDATAMVAVTYDRKAKVVRLVRHKVLTPGRNDPINFEDVEKTLLEWRQNYLLRKVWTDPFQMVSTVQRLTRAGVRIEPFAQTVGNLTEATTCLLDLVTSRTLAIYADQQMRTAVSRCIVHESSRGWRLDKAKQQHHIDIVVALSMACLAAVRGQGESSYPSDLSWVSGPDPGSDADADAAAAKAFQEARFTRHVLASSGHYSARRWS